jgi:hypothetical protein
MKHPRTNIQEPEKHQASNSKMRAQVFELGSWNFSGAWMLLLGTF